jgi:hypothetical protein
MGGRHAWRLLIFMATPHRKKKQVSQITKKIKYWIDDKGKMIPLHAMEALGVRGGIAPTRT